MQLSATFNPVTAFDSTAAARFSGAENTGERIVYSTPWLLMQNTQSRKEYLEALERPDKTWDVIKHELFYAHGRWNEDGVDVLATGLSAEELGEFIKKYEDEQETKARDAATAQKLKPDLDTLIYRKLETPENVKENAKKRKPTDKGEAVMEQDIKPARLETLHPRLNKRPSLFLA